MRILLPTFLDVLLKSTNVEVNWVHKCALRMLIKDFDSRFEELLHRNEAVKSACKKFAKLMQDAFKCISSGNPSFPWELFN